MVVLKGFSESSTMDLLIAYAKKVNFSAFCITMGLLTLLLVAIF